VKQVYASLVHCDLSAVFTVALEAVVLW